jgi:hypothetical protein
MFIDLTINHWGRSSTDASPPQQNAKAGGHVNRATQWLQRLAANWTS